MNPIEAIQSANNTAIEATMLSNNTAIEVNLDENNTPIQVLTNYNPSIVTSIRFARDTAPMVGDVVINDLGLLDVQAQFNNLQVQLDAYRSDTQSQFSDVRSQIDARAGEIGQLTTRMTAAEGQINTVKTGLNSKLTTPNGANNQFMFRNASGWVAMSPMTRAEATAGTATTGRTVSALELKAAIQTHQIQPNWNSTSGKGAILNKPDLSQYALKSELSQLSGSANEIRMQATADAHEDSGLRIEAPDEETAIVEMGPAMREAWQNAIGAGAILPLPIYGIVKGRLGGGAQVLGPRAIQDCMWDGAKKFEQNIRFQGERNSNAWLIPEDGIYTVTVAFEGVDQTRPFSLRMQKKDTNGNWHSITPRVLNAYPADNRGVTVTTTQDFRKGELVNCVVENHSDDATRLGEHDGWGHHQSHFSIVRVATLGMDTSVSARSTGRLVKKINARVNLSGGANNTIKFSFDVPTEFRGRKFKATFKFIYDYVNLNNGDKPRAVTEVFRKDWNGSSYLVDKLLFRKHTNGFHNYFELTEIYENTSTLAVMDIVLRDRDNVSPTQSGSSESAVIIETID